MRVVQLIFGILAAAVVGALALFTLGEVAAAVAVVVLLGLAIYGLFAPRPLVGTLAIAFPVILIAAAGYGGYNTYQLVDALVSTEGPTDPPDAAALASAEAKLNAARDRAGFRVELTAEEISAFLQEGLAENDTPIRRVTVSITRPAGDDRGRLEFEANFKSGSLTATGAISYSLKAGAIDVEVLDIDVGAFTVPAAVRGALEELVDSVLDIKETLDDLRATVQMVQLGDGLLAVVGTQAGGDLLTSQTLLAGLRDQAGAIGSAVQPPPERLGRGRVAQASGSSYYVALGDSLAAAVGVDDPRDGYVSRFHNQLPGDYGLENFGVSGETSGTLIRGGQLDRALDFMRANEIAYVTIDIGANDLLGHLGAEDCSRSTSDPACSARIEASMSSYRDNLDEILERVTDAAPDATVIFLLTYNPFSFGFSVIGIEQDTDRVTMQLNAVAAEVAGTYGVLVADGFSPMQGTTGATTRMAEVPPDIHPRAIGYDLLAAALVDALP